MNWTKNIISVRGFKVKVYTNKTNTQAILFPLFGRYSSLRSDSNVMDFATDFLLGRASNVVSLYNYVNSLEETVKINIAA
jgi:hypothetical protein